MQQTDSLTIEAGDAIARFSRLGAECRHWEVAGRRLTWGGEPEVWSGIAPVLFPVCGWSRNGAIRVGLDDHPMPVHGFAAGKLFAAEQRGPDTIVFRLHADAPTRLAYPFDFELELAYRLTPHTLEACISVQNQGQGPMPYACGLHPGFVWQHDKGAHRFHFSLQERPEVPIIAPGGLFSRRTRPVPLRGRVLDLAPDLFSEEALCFLDVAGRSVAYETPWGTLEIEAPDFPHLILWSRAPGDFLAIESWTGTGDPEGFDGDLFARPSMIHLRPGERRQHRVLYRWANRTGFPRLADGTARA
ncbi:MAG: aldose epimerase [Hyphomicrobiales bacterium]|nr:aldose epimerase [Hyphomicrobiales bacterium]